MYDLKKIMVALDLSEMDNVLIEYTDYIEEVLNPGIIYFVHVETEPEAHELETGIEAYHLHEQEENVQKVIQKAVDGHFMKKTKVEARVRKLKGSVLKELLHFVKDEKIDLAIVGAKNTERGSGVVPQRFARKSPCSVLFVPEKPSLRMKKIFVPTDLSEYSKMAFDEVRYFKEEIPEVRILTQHIYKVPLGYYKTGKSYEEFAEIMHENARKHFDQYIKKIGAEDLDLEPVFTLEDHHPSETILKKAEKENVDLIIIGAKGHSATSALLLGSIVEKCLVNANTIPFLILKKKGETLGFLDALLKL